MKIVIAPDKFKGSLTSQQVCDSLAAGLLSVHPSAEIISLPMADGGDGFAAILKKYYQTETVVCESFDPLFKPISAGYEWSASTKTAIVELAVTSGLVLLAANERDPLKTSTYGTGLVINAAIEKGAEKILLGLGGSATNDAGMGILQALGFRFLDNDGMQLEPVGKNLIDVVSVEAPATLPLVHFIIACDVTNPLYGSNGAAAVYAQQKGADNAAVAELDAGLRNLNEILVKQTGTDHSSIAGSGAAGGIAAGLMSFFSVELRQGIDIVSDVAGLAEAIDGADFVLTGEGQLDAQSSAGKVVSYVAMLAGQRKIPVVVFAGLVTLDSEVLNSMGFHDVFAISKTAVSLQDSMINAARHLRSAGKIWLAGITNE